jgi:hypothetical protein
MAKTVRVDLHAVDREVRKVQQQLKAAADSAESVEARRIGSIIRKLESVRRSTSRICSKSWGVFPAASPASARKAPPKPAAAKKRG